MKLLTRFSPRKAEGKLLLALTCMVLIIALQGYIGILSSRGQGDVSSEKLAVIFFFAALLTGVSWYFYIIRSVSGSLTSSIETFADVSEQVKQTADRISAVSHQLVRNASEQSATFEDTSSSLKEISSVSEQNMENACEVETLIEETFRLVEQSSGSMTELTGSIQEISEASERTSVIMKTIDEIAFQTNLLALNAAVEAAHAGEAGAGFAVVADEVRSLAMRAAKAAKDTSDLIEGIVTKVGNGTEIVSKTDQAFKKVSEETQKVVVFVYKITTDSRNQLERVNQISTGVQDIDRLVRQNGSDAEESLAVSAALLDSADQMNRILADLKNLVSSQ
ncbi:methyl-accepting chemotaxis protein [Desulfococcaceae bacterium HSG8]|nr:methyl-accepting chemotaxis protein [Desulfococcaceae bacterium HSG8]